MVVFCPCTTIKVELVLDAVTTPGVCAEVSIANLKAVEVPPPGPGLKIVISARPTFARSAEVMDAVICETLTKVVVRGDPFQLRTASGTKSFPLTVSEKALPLAGVITGERLSTVGAIAEIVSDPAAAALL